MIKLIFPPFCDPTQSYPSLPILNGYLSDHGISANICDWNIEGHLNLLKAKGFNEVTKIFKAEELFYNDTSYQQGKELLLSFYRQLSAESVHYQFSNNAHFHQQGPWNFKRLKQFCQHKHSPFDSFYRNEMKKWTEIKWLGLSCTFVSQLPEVFYIAALAKTIFPGLKIVVGGPAIAQAVEAMNDQQSLLKKFFEYFDFLCYDEGEITLAKLFSPNPIPLLDIPNLLFVEKGEIIRTRREKLKAEDFALPNYSGFDLNQYLAPSPIILYNPSRGCYWNRCSFCHYGFNQVDGVGYREVSARKAVDQLRQLKNKYDVQHFYFSSDVLSPRFARQFAQLAIEEKLEIFWSTDLRIEKNYTPELCQLLAQSGMVSVAFGIESGSDSLLELIDKGITAGEIVEINRNFSSAGIATCWMTFNYHPKETIIQALETLELIDRESERVSLFIAGEFGLTVGSKIYRDPKKYGLSGIDFHPDDQFKIYPFFEMEALPNLSIDASKRIDRQLRKIEKKYLLAPYPFKGAISTHHSFLYFKKNGASCFRPR